MIISDIVLDSQLKLFQVNPRSTPSRKLEKNNLAPVFNVRKNPISLQPDSDLNGTSGFTLFNRVYNRFRRTASMVPCSWNSREVDLFDTPFSGFYTTPPRNKDTAETNFGQMLLFLNKSGFGGSDRFQESGSACRLWMDRSRSSEEFYSPDWKPVPIMVYIFQISKIFFLKVRFPIF